MGAVGRGESAAEDVALEICALTNLQTDTSGVARPPARAANSKGSVTVPVLSEDGQTVLAIIGLGFADEREFSDKEIARYTDEVKSVLDIAG